MYLPQWLEVVKDTKLNRLVIREPGSRYVLAYFDTKTMKWVKFYSLLSEEKYIVPVSNKEIDNITKHTKFTKKDFEQLGIRSIDWEDLIEMRH